ncbi:MAG: DJ-1/PfpI family protein [Micromonosporaceae bacterium]|jgi:putative intracellular protease/amidase|nr:DJ-1/PfpI family protein [Micromonosporaceae bacterium]
MSGIHHGRRAGVLRFTGHFVQMALAMAIGMVVLDPVWRLALPASAERVDVLAIVAATDMSIGMALWMRLRRHGWASIREMSAAMYVPFLLLLVPYWAGGISGSTVMMGGHVLMVPAMLVAMLRRRAEYTHARHGHGSPGRRRWRRVLVRTGVIAVAVLAPPAVVGSVNAVTYLHGVYQPPADVSVPASLDGVDSPVHDPAKPTAVVLVGNRGANAADTLAPYETLAASGAFNLYTVAPKRQRVTLTGGLDLVPDLDFAGLQRRLAGRVADVVVVPAMPDATAASSARLRAWLTHQAQGGALVLSVCQGAEVLAEAGLLDGHDATSHWFRVGGLEDRYPRVRWHRGTRYVDDGDVITTGGVLSGIDGALRVVERLAGRQAASTAATAVGWTHYSPGAPQPLPRSAFGLHDMITGVNLSFRSHRDIGVLLTDGVGELELASVFITYSDVSYIARTVALGVTGTEPVRSRHGLVFVPRQGLFDAKHLDRLIVPGADAARAHDPALDSRVRAELGLSPEYIHGEPGFAIVPVLEDLARTVDVPTAQWRAKQLEFPGQELDLNGPGWPWGATLLPLLYSLAGLAVTATVWLALRARRTRRLAGGRLVPSADRVDVPGPLGLSGPTEQDDQTLVAEAAGALRGEGT